MLNEIQNAWLLSGYASEDAGDRHLSREYCAREQSLERHFRDFVAIWKWELTRCKKFNFKMNGKKALKNYYFNLKKYVWK